jgi:hypothetical protein
LRTSAGISPSTTTAIARRMGFLARCYTLRAHAGRSPQSTVC